MKLSKILLTSTTLLLSCSYGAGQQQDEPVHTLRVLSKPTEAPRVKGSLNGAPEVVLGIDTGSTSSILRPEVFGWAGIERKSLVGSDGRAIIKYPDGRTALGGYVRTLVFGDTGLRNIPFVEASRDVEVVLVQHKVQGLLGLNLLKHFVTLFDPKRSELRLMPEPHLSAQRVAELGFVVSDRVRLEGAGETGLLQVTLRVKGPEGSEDCKFILDTGTGMTEIPKSAADRLGLRRTGALHEVYTERGLYRTAEVNAMAINLGRATYLDLKMITNESPRASSGEVGLLGMDVMGRQKFLLDVKGQSLYLDPSVTLGVSGKD